MGGNLYEFYGVVLLLYSSAALVIFHYVYTRKRMQPLKFREPHLMLLSLIGGLFTTAMICFREIAPDQFSCSVYVWVACLFPPAFFCPYFLRCMKLKFSYHWLQQRSESREAHMLSKTTGAVGESWYLKRRKWFSQGTLLVIFFIIFGAHVLLGFMVDMSIETTSVGADHHQEDQHMIFKPVEYRHAGCIFEYEFFIFLIVALSYVAMLVLCLVSLRNVRDAFGVRREMTICAVLWIVCLVPFFCFNLTPEFFWINEVFPNANWIIIMSAGSMIISLGIPMIQTFSDAASRAVLEMKTSVDIEVRRIPDILQNETLLEAFRNYLVSRLDHNNIDVLLFLVRIWRYKGECNEIYSQYQIEVQKEMERKSMCSMERVKALEHELGQELSRLAAGIWREYIEDFSPHCLVVLKNVNVGELEGKKAFPDVTARFRTTSPANYGTVFDDIVALSCHHLQQEVMADFSQSRFYKDLYIMKKSNEGVLHALREEGLL